MDLNTAEARWFPKHRVYFEVPDLKVCVGRGGAWPPLSGPCTALLCMTILIAHIMFSEPRRRRLSKPSTAL